MMNKLFFVHTIELVQYTEQNKWWFGFPVLVNLHGFIQFKAIATCKERRLNKINRENPYPFYF